MWIALQLLKGENPDQASAVRFQTLAEAIPQIVWIARLEWPHVVHQ
jgi:hypothetical protein